MTRYTVWAIDANHEGRVDARTYVGVLHATSAELAFEAWCDTHSESTAVPFAVIQMDYGPSGDRAERMAVLADVGCLWPPALDDGINDGVVWATWPVKQMKIWPTPEVPFPVWDDRPIDPERAWAVTRTMCGGGGSGDA